MITAERAASSRFEIGQELLQLANRLEANGRNIVHLDYGDPDFPTPDAIVDAAERALRDGLTHYTPAGGLPAVRSAVAEWASRTHGVEVTPDQVIVTSGATQALLVTMLCLLDRGSEVIVPDPCHPPFLEMVRLAGGTAVPVPVVEERGFRPDLDALRFRIGPGTAAVLLNSPHNPTGGVLGAEDLEAIAELATSHGLYVISDEVYGDLVYDHDRPGGGRRAASVLSVPWLAEHAIYVDSMSKSYAMCGWRIGFAIVPRSLACRLESVLRVAGICAASFGQAAMVEALRSPSVAAARERMCVEYRRRRDMMVEGLNRIPGFRCPTPAGAFYAFPEVTGTGLDDIELTRRLLVDGRVMVLPGSSFGGAGEGRIRLTYATSTERIEEGLRRIARVVTA